MKVSEHLKAATGKEVVIVSEDMKRRQAEMLRAWIETNITPIVDDLNQTLIPYRRENEEQRVRSTGWLSNFLNGPSSPGAPPFRIETNLWEQQERWLSISPYSDHGSLNPSDWCNFNWDQFSSQEENRGDIGITAQFFYFDRDRYGMYDDNRGMKHRPVAVNLQATSGSDGNPVISKGRIITPPSGISTSSQGCTKIFSSASIKEMPGLIHKRLAQECEHELLDIAKNQVETPAARSTPYTLG